MRPVHIIGIIGILVIITGAIVTKYYAFGAYAPRPAITAVPYGITFIWMPFEEDWRVELNAAQPTTLYQQYLRAPDFRFNSQGGAVRLPWWMLLLGWMVLWAIITWLRRRRGGRAAFPVETKPEFERV